MTGNPARAPGAGRGAENSEVNHRTGNRFESAALIEVRPFPSPQAPRAWPDTVNLRAQFDRGCALFP